MFKVHLNSHTFVLTEEEKNHFGFFREVEGDNVTVKNIYFTEFNFLFNLVKRYIDLDPYEKGRFLAPTQVRKEWYALENYWTHNKGKDEVERWFIPFFELLDVSDYLDCTIMTTKLIQRLALKLFTTYGSFTLYDILYMCKLEMTKEETRLFNANKCFRTNWDIDTLRFDANTLNREVATQVYETYVHIGWLDVADNWACCTESIPTELIQCPYFVVDFLNRFEDGEIKFSEHVYVTSTIYSHHKNDSKITSLIKQKVHPKRKSLFNK